LLALVGNSGLTSKPGSFPSETRWPFLEDQVISWGCIYASDL